MHIFKEDNSREVCPHCRKEHDQNFTSEFCGMKHYVCGECNHCKQTFHFEEVAMSHVNWRRC